MILLILSSVRVRFICVFLEKIFERAKFSIEILLTAHIFNIVPAKCGFYELSRVITENICTLKLKKKKKKSK